MVTHTNPAASAAQISAVADGARVAADALRKATGAIDLPGNFFVSPGERMALLEAATGPTISPAIQRAADEFAENQRIHLAVSEAIVPSLSQRSQVALADYDLRCRRKKHMRVLAGASGLVEVACRNCRVSAGRDAVHRFDLATGEIVDTSA